MPSSMADRNKRWRRGPLEEAENAVIQQEFCWSELQVRGAQKYLLCGNETCLDSHPDSPNDFPSPRSRVASGFRPTVVFNN